MAFHWALRSVLWLILLASPMLAQLGMRQTLWGTKEGLSQSFVYCMLEDHRGLMWFGTRNGLNRFDGTTFQRYLHIPFDTTNISHGTITTLVEDRRGMLWVGTDGGGVNLFDPHTGRARAFRHREGDGRTLASDFVTALLLHEDTLWIGMAGGGVQYLPLRDTVGTSTFSGIFHSLSCLDEKGEMGSIAGTIHRIHRVPDGTLWIARIDGIVEVSGDRHRLRRYRAPFDDGTGISESGYFAMDLDGTMWTIANHLLRAWDPRQHLFSNTLPIPDRYCYVGVVGFTPKKLILAHVNMLCMIDRATKRIQEVEIGGGALRSKDGGPLSMLVASDGALWIGTTGGVVRVEMQTPSMRRILPSSKKAGESDIVRAFVQEPSGEVLVSLINRPVHIFHEDGDRLEPIARLPRDDAFQRVNALLRIDPTTCWIGTADGIRAWNRRRKTSTRIEFPSGLERYCRRSNVYLLTWDRSGAIWAGGRKGRTGFLYRYRSVDGTWTPFHRHSALPRGADFGSGAWCLIEDRHGMLWVGTSNGLFLIHPRDGVVRHWLHDPQQPNSLSANEIWCLHETADGTLWIATLGGGMDALDAERKRVFHFGEKEGLRANCIHAIEEDGQGRLWLSTNDGVYRYDRERKQFSRFMSPAISDLEEFSPGSHLALADGRIIFGGLSGFLIVDPAITEPFPERHRPLITALHVNGILRRHIMETGEEYELSADENTLTFSFACPAFGDHSALVLETKLEGVDSSWIPAGSRTSITYVTMPPGKYVFRVGLRSADSSPSDNAAFITLRIVPPFHQRTWVRLLAGLLLLGGVAGLWLTRQRLHRKKVQLQRRILESELTALRAQINPHFFFNSLNSIHNFIMMNHGDEASAYLAKFAKLMRGILEASHAQMVTLGEEIEFVRLYAELEEIRFAGRFRTEFLVDSELDLDRDFPSMLIQPIVENAIRHGLLHRGEGGLLTIRVTEERNTLIWIVEDNGVGRAFSASLRTSHEERCRVHGFPLVQERIAILNEAKVARLTLRVEDIHREDGCSAGTRVSITMQSIAS